MANNIPGCLIRIKTTYPTFSDTEKMIADYILSDPDVIHKTITQAAKNSGVGYGSMDRFCKKLNYSGFQELKIRLAEDLAVRKASVEGENGADLLNQMARRAIQDIQNTVQLVSNKQINQAARAILKSRFVMVAGLSSSAGIALGIDYRLGRFGIQSCIAIDNHIQRHRAANLTRRDVALLVTFSGTTKEILATAEIARKNKAKVICLTNYADSPITELADISLVTGIESDPLGAEIASKVAMEFVVTSLFESIARSHAEVYQSLITTFEATADSQL